MEMKVSYAIQALVEAMLPRFSDEHLGLKINVEARLSYFEQIPDGGGMETKHWADIHLLFHRPTNYTKVFWCVALDSVVHYFDLLPDMWDLKSDHDSCWSSDGLDSPLNKVWWTLRERFSPDIPYHDLSPFVMFCRDPSLVRVDIDKVSAMGDYPKKYSVVIHEPTNRHDLIREMLKQESLLPLLINVPGWGALVKNKLRDSY